MLIISCGSIRRGALHTTANEVRQRPHNQGVDTIERSYYFVIQPSTCERSRQSHKRVLYFSFFAKRPKLAGPPRTAHRRQRLRGSRPSKCCEATLGARFDQRSHAPMHGSTTVKTALLAMPSSSISSLHTFHCANSTAKNKDRSCVPHGCDIE